jgi:hypothetical protein
VNCVENAPCEFPSIPLNYLEIKLRREIPASVVRCPVNAVIVLSFKVAHNRRSGNPGRCPGLANVQAASADPPRQVCSLC